MSTFEKLVEQRKKMNIKQKDIAAYLGIDKSTLSRYESQERLIDANRQDEYAKYIGYKLEIVLL